MMQRSLDANLSAFIVAEDWSLRSSDLNPLDYRSWNILEEADCHKSRNNEEDNLGENDINIHNIKFFLV